MPEYYSSPTAKVKTSQLTTPLAIIAVLILGGGGLMLYARADDPTVLNINTSIINASGSLVVAEDINATRINVNETVIARQVISRGAGLHPVGFGKYVETYMFPDDIGRIACYDGSSSTFCDMVVGDWQLGNPNLIVKPGGGIGINTSTPRTALDVNGTIMAKDLIVKNITVGNITVSDKLYVLGSGYAIDINPGGIKMYGTFLQYGSTTFWGNVIQAGGTYYSASTFINYAWTTDLKIYPRGYASGYDLILGKSTNESSVMLIGNTSIGRDTTPSHELNVFGSTNITDNLFVSKIYTDTISLTPTTVQTSDYTVTDDGKSVIMIDDSVMMTGLTVYLPTVADNTGRTIKVINIDSTVALTTITVTAEGVELINGQTSYTKLDAAYDTASFYTDGTQWFLTSETLT